MTAGSVVWHWAGTSYNRSHVWCLAGQGKLL